MIFCIQRIIGLDSYGLWTIVYGLILTLVSLNVLAQTQTNNYVITKAPRIVGIINDSTLSANSSNNAKVQTSIQYVDGLGRPKQTVQMQASPLGHDMIQPQAYDQYSREITKYLPYTPQTGTAGSFRPNAVSTDQGAFYTNPPTGSGVTAITDPYAQTAFDNSPLSRPVEQGAPGVPWQLTGVSGGGHTVKMIYTLNNATAFSADSINGRQAAMYYTTINSDNSQTLHANGYYPASSLTVTISKDENWASGRAGTVEEYKDIDGHVVLKRVYNYTSTVQVLSTYYVYDDLGRLAFVLPPLSGADGAGTISQTTLNNLCYQYQYDERGRPVQKKIPGKWWEYTVFNTMDQPVASQDSLQRANKNWIFVKYDAQGRGVMTGIWNNGGTAVSRASLQSTLTSIITNLYEASIITGNGYTNVAWPTTNVTATLTINYYDNYTNMPGMPTAYTAPAAANLATRGELTGTQTNVLGTTNMLWTAHYYDYWGRSLKSYAQHYLGGTLSGNNYDAISSTYNFTNAPTTVTRQHWNTTSTAYPLVTIANTYIYDQVGRKLKSWEQITNGNNTPTTKTLLSLAVYNEIGQVTKKSLHSTDSLNFLQAIAYTYNERGWLLTSSAPLFAMQLYYNTSSGHKQYNGNIMYQFWGVPGNLNNNYTYLYDKLNRLTYGNSGTINNENGITYDLMGNLITLNRYQTSTFIDQLTYTYTDASGNYTNQVQKIVDARGSNAGLASGTTTYLYDGNGNELSATNTVNTAGNKSFTYNLLNLPLVATFAAGTATYTYDATGNKLRKADLKSGVTTTTDYISGIEYDNSTTAIGFIQTEEGKAVPNGTGFDYTYYLGDNLGNTRITFGTKTGAAVVYQSDDYYPFGMEINNSVLSPKNEYLYNKKELQEETQTYDYGARFYDPVIARWNTIDPLSELSRRWSPYNYVENNPIRLTDPDGMESEDEINANENRRSEEKAGFEAGESPNSSHESGFEKNGQHEEEATKTNSGTAAGVTAATSGSSSGTPAAPGTNAEPDANQPGNPQRSGRAKEIGPPVINGSLSALSLLGHYLKGVGTDYILSKNEFNAFLKAMQKAGRLDKIRNKGVPVPNMPGLYEVVISTYGTSYERAVGGAVLYYNDAGFVGYSDWWNFNSEPWGKRSPSGEALTRFGNSLPGIPFYVIYGITPPVNSIPHD
ncbi:MAG TPA: DUF6443 domain-containing protein [Mucilaginibacter sp.]|jgi:RHS repeat-associated protein